MMMIIIIINEPEVGEYECRGPCTSMSAVSSSSLLVWSDSVVTIPSSFVLVATTSSWTQSQKQLSIQV